MSEHYCKRHFQITNVKSLPVIILDDIAHSPDSGQVFIIAFWVDIVEGSRSPGVSIRACKVNGNLAKHTKDIGDAQRANTNVVYVTQYMPAGLKSF